MVSSSTTKQHSRKTKDEDATSDQSLFPKGPSIVKTQLQAFGQTKANRYKSLRVETIGTMVASTNVEEPATIEGRGAEDDRSSSEQQRGDEEEQQPSPSETTRRLVDSFRRRGEGPSNVVAACPKTKGAVRPMSPVSEYFLENLQTQRQRSEERVQVIKKLRQLKEQQTKPDTPESDSCTEFTVPEHSAKANTSTQPDTRTGLQVISPRTQPEGGPSSAFHSLKGAWKNPTSTIESGALRHYGEIHSVAKSRLPPIANKDEFGHTRETTDSGAEELSVKSMPVQRSGTYRSSFKPIATKPFSLPIKDSSTRESVTKLRTVNKVIQTFEARETFPTQRSEASSANSQKQHDELRESNSSNSSSQDDSSLTLERDRANSFLVELAKAKAEILELQQRLVAADNASQATREELSQIRQQRAPFWKRGAKKGQHQAGLGSRTVEDNEDFVKQLLNVIHTLPVCDEICLRINLLSGEGGWEIVSARAENPRLKHDGTTE